MPTWGALSGGAGVGRALRAVPRVRCQSVSSVPPAVPESIAEIVGAADSPRRPLAAPGEPGTASDQAVSVGSQQERVPLAGRVAIAIGDDLSVVIDADGGGEGEA
jgi:hypothetical protein